MAWNSAESSVYGHRPQVCDPVLIFSRHIFLRSTNKNLIMYLWIWLLSWFPFSIFPVHSWIWPFFISCSPIMLFHIPYQFIITFQFNPLVNIMSRMAWFIWHSYILIVTGQHNILGYWWTWWHNWIWHFYSGHTSFNMVELSCRFFFVRAGMMGWLLINLSVLARSIQDATLSQSMILYQIFSVVIC